MIIVVNNNFRSFHLPYFRQVAAQSNIDLSTIDKSVLEPLLVCTMFYNNATEEQGKSYILDMLQHFSVTFLVVDDTRITTRMPGATISFLPCTHRGELAMVTAPLNIIVQFIKSGDTESSLAVDLYDYLVNQGLKCLVSNVTKEVGADGLVPYLRVS